MKRTIQLNPSALLTGDWHLTENQPTCRTDNFWEAQWEKVDAVRELQQRYNCPVLHSGDLFDHWKPSPYLLSCTIDRMPEDMYVVYGNHDLPQHSLDKKDKSGIETLRMAGKLNVLEGIHWGETPEKGAVIWPGLESPRLIAAWHVMTFKTGKPPWPGCEDLSTKEILEAYPEFDLIMTGHHHKTFTEEMDGRLLVNPGSLTRQSADQIDHLPSVFLWYEETNTVKRVLLPCEKNVISREHIDEPKRRKARMEAYIKNMEMGWQAGLSFEKNLERFFGKNKVSKKVRDIIWDSLETT